MCYVCLCMCVCVSVSCVTILYQDQNIQDLNIVSNCN